MARLNGTLTDVAGLGVGHWTDAEAVAGLCGVPAAAELPAPEEERWAAKARSATEVGAVLAA